MRGQIRGGRAPAELRRELLESGDPDHRHAGRLLQAIADEAPEPVLTRAGGVGRVERPTGPDPTGPDLTGPDPTGPDPTGPEPVGPEPVGPDPVKPEPVGPKPVAEPIGPDPVGPTELARPDPTGPGPSRPGQEDPPAPGPVPTKLAATSALDVDTYDPPPKLSSLPKDGPVRAWFDAGLTALEPEPTGDLGEPEIASERLFGPELLLLRERPPVVAAPQTDHDAGPRLVILTSMSLRADASGDAIVLEMSGAGPAALAFTPRSSTHVRVRILNAGAVPSFLAARPTRPELEVVEVTRRGTTVEVEIEFGSEWSLIGAGRLANGASVRFERRR
ncbi:Vegetative cell wall protein gp1 [Enhygromyxa salina]|uniref:Vegetative cell wall protein gp1 n=1 Tax=Enhygromyxa salina TaxID=215803 RepID=A0A0C2CMJ6_9BACT|nr:Vegetative cell wall protein gp1 [Enhygromyxa salina]